MSNEWKLVPVEPTGEQEEAGCRGYMEADGNWVMHPSSMGHAYKAMLEVAPQPPALGGEPIKRFHVWQDRLGWHCKNDPEGNSVNYAHVAPLLANIDQLKLQLETTTADRDAEKSMKATAIMQRDTLKAQNVELLRLLGLAWGANDVSAKDCRAIDSALAAKDGAK